MTDDDVREAHEALAARIKGLDASGIEKCRQFKATHGWPLPAELFEELGSIVTAREVYMEELT